MFLFLEGKANESSVATLYYYLSKNDSSRFQEADSVEAMRGLYNLAIHGGSSPAAIDYMKLILEKKNKPPVLIEVQMLVVLALPNGYTRSEDAKAILKELTERFPKDVNLKRAKKFVDFPQIITEHAEISKVFGPKAARDCLKIAEEAAWFDPSHTTRTPTLPSRAGSLPLDSEEPELMKQNATTLFSTTSPLSNPLFTDDEDRLSILEELDRLDLQTLEEIRTEIDRENQAVKEVISQLDTQPSQATSSDEDKFVAFLKTLPDDFKESNQTDMWSKR